MGILHDDVKVPEVDTEFALRKRDWGNTDKGAGSFRQKKDDWFGTRGGVAMPAPTRFQHAIVNAGKPHAKKGK